MDEIPIDPWGNKMMMSFASATPRNPEHLMYDRRVKGELLCTEREDCN